MSIPLGGIVGIGCCEDVTLGIRSRDSRARGHRSFTLICVF